MPSVEELQRIKRFLQTDVCGCGNPRSEHADTVEGISQVPFSCSLTKQDVFYWHQIPARKE